MLVLRPGALGDTLLAVPALRALRRAFGAITLAAHPGASRLLEHVGEIEHGLAFEDPSLGWLFGGGSPPDDVVAWMSRTPGLHNARVVAPSRPSDVQHCASYLLSTLTPLGIDLACDARPLTIPAVSSDEVLLHVGSGSPTKNWPPECFAATLRSLTAPVRLIVGEADVQAAARLEAALGYTLRRVEHQPLQTLAASLAGCRAYLGNDSGVSHLAGLCGARSFVLFGPTNPEIWRPLGPRVHVVPFDVDPTVLAQRVLSAASA